MFIPKYLRKKAITQLYTKLLLSFIFIVVITITLISGALFQRFSESSSQEISEISISLLQQTSYTSDIIFQQAFQVANQMMNDNEIFTAMYMKQHDYKLTYIVAMNLRFIKSVYPFINSVGIYNGTLHKYTDYLNSGYTDDKLTEKLIIDYMPNNNYVFFPRTIRYQYNTLTPYKNVLTFILYPSFANNINLTGAFVINIDENYLRKTIDDIYKDKNDTVIVVDSKGLVISHTDNSQFLENYSEKPYISRIIYDKQPSGYFNMNLDGQKKLISYVTSKELGWTYLSIRDYDSLISNIKKLREFTLLAGALIAVFGIILAFLLSRNFYNPIKALVKKIGSLSKNEPNEPETKSEIEYLSTKFQSIYNKASDLEKTIDKVYPALVETYFTYLLNGKSTELTENLKLISELDQQLEGLRFSVIQVVIDRYDHLPVAVANVDKTKLILVVYRIASDILGRNYGVNNLAASEGALLILLHSRQPAVFQDVMPLLKLLQDVVEQDLEITISISIGDIANSKKEIHNSSMTAQEYMNYRFFYGKNAILHYELLKNRIDHTDKYDYGIEKKLIDAIQLNKEEKVKQAVTEFIVFIAPASYNSAELFAHQFMISALKQFSIATNTIDEEYQTFYSEMQKISSMETIDDMKALIENFCLKMCVMLHSRNDNRNTIIVQQVKEFAELKYPNADLSLDMVADQVHLSAGYLGMLFKTYTGLSFGEYLNKVRMEKVKELLSATTATTTEICEKVGIYNNTYFFTLFKKAYGITPTQFRKQQGGK